MQSTQEKKGEALVITIQAPRIDSVNSTQFKNLLIDAVNQGNMNLVIDLTQVDFMDSSGLSGLLSSLRSINKKGEILLVGLSEKITKLFVVTKMDRVFKIYPNVSKALDEL